jgi:putative hydrolase of the HAD superfamily
VGISSILRGLRAVCFDAVGTLIHPDPPAAVVYAAVGRRFGSRLTVEAIGPRFVRAFQREEAVDQENGLRTSEARERERWHRIVTEVLDDVVDIDACFHELFEHFARPTSWRCDHQGAVVLNTLAERGLELAMASNYDRRLYSVCAGLPELAPVQHVIISSEVGWRKPAAEFFAGVTRTIGASSEDILLVGDDPMNDFAGARAVGLRAILFDPIGRTQGPSGERISRLSELVT